MGNSMVRCCVAGEGLVRVMTAEGQVEEFELPISAGQVMDRHPGYLLLDTTCLESRENKQTGQVVLDEITFVASAVALQPGRLYVLYTAPHPSTTTTTTTPAEPEKSKSALPHVPAALPHRPVPPDVKKIVPSPELDLSSSLENSPAFPCEDSIDQFEQFTPTFTRRRSSVVIASDILHSFKVKKEAAVDVAVVPEPKEEKPKGHGWSPSLSSIPESPATSLRALELPAAAAATQLCKTPPRISSNLNELVKQAILHKHPRSFWR